MMSYSVVELTSFASLSLRFSIDELHAENGERDQDESTHLVLSARRTLDSEGNTASSPLVRGPVNQSRGAKQVTCRRFIEESLIKLKLLLADYRGIAKSVSRSEN